MTSLPGHIRPTHAPPILRAQEPERAEALAQSPLLPSAPPAFPRRCRSISNASRKRLKAASSEYMGTRSTSALTKTSANSDSTTVMSKSTSFSILARLRVAQPAQVSIVAGRSWVSKFWLIGANKRRVRTLPMSAAEGAERESVQSSEENGLGSGTLSLAREHRSR
eukprot:scaffold8329_cov277-Pinguiococcus_pyrenoidosus.AAC.2